MEQEVSKAEEMEAYINAIHRAQAIIEFNLKGEILDANANFLETLGYELDEIVGQHHKMFCDDEYAQSPEYKPFWKHLAQGQYHSGLYKRVAKDGSDIWINASYNPIFDQEGNPVKVVKFATDVTEATIESANAKAHMAAVDRSQATIEFDLDGNILTANQNFLDTVGYDLDEITGKHHSIFCEDAISTSSDYKDFWKQLRQGQYQAGLFKRQAKDGSDTWINASYNPVFDAEGNPSKIVKFASNVTESTQQSAEFEAYARAIDRAQATIEFDLDGNILTANENFLDTVGYVLDEIVDKHHSIFCEEDYSKSAEYKEFWKLLGQGQHHAGTYKRKGKDGHDIWINASYNPVFDADGNPVKVVKFATDVTESTLKSAEFEAVSMPLIELKLPLNLT